MLKKNIKSNNSEKATPVVRRGRKATGLIFVFHLDSRVASYLKLVFFGGKMKKLIVIFLGIFLFAPISANAAVADFEGLTLPTAYTGTGGGAYYNGSDGSTGFLSGDAWFTNTYSSDYGSWDGFAYSNTTDITTAGYLNQYSACTGSGVNGSANYGVGYGTGYGGRYPTISLGAVTGEDYNTTLSGMYVTNTTYAALSMLQGDSFAKKIGGVDGNDEDWFKMTVKGITETGYTANTLDFFLADFRFADNSEDYIVDEWTWMDLSGLGNVIGVEFSLSSSDVGAWGMNTPAYFALDDFNGTAPSSVPVPAAIWLLGSGILGLIGIRRKVS